MSLRGIFGSDRPAPLPPAVAGPTAPVVPVAPTPIDPAVSFSGGNQRSSSAAAYGSTLLTGPQGLSEKANTAKKSLLGQ
jgi:hypothetical protein